MISFKDVFNEKRKVDLGPRESAYSELIKYKDRALSKKDIYVSFTKILKLGINPQSKYNTPLGIYSYPLDKFINDLEKKRYKPMTDVFPFAGNSTYIQVFTPKNNRKVITDLYKYNSKNFDDDMNKLFKKYGKEHFENDRVKFDRWVDSTVKKSRNSSPGGSMWFVTMIMADLLVGKVKGKHPVKWNYILSNVLGYDGIVDREAQRIIHSAEPVQGVFFNKSTIKHLETIENKVEVTTTSEKFLNLTVDDVKKIVNGEIVDHKYELPDWLDIADFKNATVSIKINKVFWKSGIWEGGDWKGGTWVGGIWENGIWNDGTWKDGEWKRGYWKNGTWEDGIWKNGTWLVGDDKDGNNHTNPPNKW